MRQALAKRFQYVLVDELQDTDPLQIEILWRLCGEAPKNGNTQPLARVPRAGALFLVGDPKQAIYRFRGADVNAYLAAREAIGAEALLEIVANFRSVESILNFVNLKFEKPLSSETGQPGFTALAATRKAEKDVIGVAALDIAVEGEETSAEMLRDAEAERIAELCTRLVGNVQVRDRGGISPKELAATVVRTLNLPEVAALRPHLVPEHTEFGVQTDGRTQTLTSGIADAVARDADDKIDTIIDWKSDVEMNDDKIAAYRPQLSDYRKQTGAKRTLLILMTTGKILNA